MNNDYWFKSLNTIRLFILCCFFSLDLAATIIECRRLNEILPLIDEETLVVFNVNNVLTVSSQDAASTPWAEDQISRIMKRNNTSKTHATNLFIPLWHDVLIATDVELFDPEAEAIIGYLQSKGIKVMALTNRYTEMAYPTHKHLRSVGIDFSKNPPYLEDCPIAGVASPAKYVEGILFNGLINFKGNSLVSFLQQIEYTPKKLIYIEDKANHLAQVGELITSLGIPFIGVHFGALDLQRQAYRPELAALQVKFHQDILDDFSAQRICEMREITLPVTNLVEMPLILPENIQRITSIEELKQDLVPRTLVVTELDHVLWSTQGSIGARSFLDYMENKYLMLGHSAPAARAKAARLTEKVHRRAQARLIEEKSPAFFDELSARNCWSVAVTYRTMRLIERTAEQLKGLGVHFNSPFQADGVLEHEDIICAREADSQFADFEKKLSKMEVLPALIIAVSSNLSDLYKIQEIAISQSISFEGRLFSPSSPQQVLLDDELLTIELEYLDHLLSNEEADFLLKNQP